jgi:hypothetical protein
MPTIKRGDLSLKEVPGTTIEDDGEGLLTSRVTFRGQRGGEKNRPTTGTVHPDDSRLQCYRSSYTLEGQTCTVVSEYVGIDSGVTTKIKWTSDTSSSVQPIQSHPNFVTARYSPKPLKEMGWDPERQIYPDSSAEAEVEGLLGVRSFMAPEQTVSGYFYTSDKSWLQKWVDGVGKTFTSLPNDSDAVVTTTFQAVSKNHTTKALLATVSYEKYAHLYKVNFSSRIATGGWNKLIYQAAV